MFEIVNGIAMNSDRAFLYFKLCARGGNISSHWKMESYIIKVHGVERPRISTVGYINAFISSKNENIAYALINP